jgi:hypothetical protein
MDGERRKIGDRMINGRKQKTMSSFLHTNRFYSSLPAIATLLPYIEFFGLILYLLTEQSGNEKLLARLDKSGDRN